MTHWFGPFVDLPPDHGYFYLCPACYRTLVQPHLEALQGRLAELHPLTRHPDPAGANGDAPGHSTPTAPIDRARAADEAARRSSHARTTGEAGEVPAGS